MTPPVCLEDKLRARRALPDPIEQRRILAAVGASPAEVARELGVSDTCVRSWLHGRRRPSGPRLISYTALLGRLRDLEAAPQ